MGGAEQVEDGHRHGGHCRVGVKGGEGELKDERVPEAEGEAEHREHPDLHSGEEAVPLLSLLGITSRIINILFQNYNVLI